MLVLAEPPTVVVSVVGLTLPRLLNGLLIALIVSFRLLLGARARCRETESNSSYRGVLMFGLLTRLLKLPRLLPCWPTFCCAGGVLMMRFTPGSQLPARLLYLLHLHVPVCRLNGTLRHICRTESMSIRSCALGSVVCRPDVPVVAMILSKYALLSTLAACVLMVLTPFATKAATKPDGSYAFSILSATLLAEMSKLVISSVLYIRLPVSQQTHHLVDARYAVSFAVPALIYTANNFLVYLILSLTSAAAFLLLSSTKILFTGILFRLFLKRRLRSVQCSAIVLLAAGVALARAPTCRADDIGSGWQDNDEWAGNALALLAWSAFAGIYNEA